MNLMELMLLGSEVRSRKTEVDINMIVNSSLEAKVPE
jgi:hypothetical protein